MFREMDHFRFAFVVGPNRWVSGEKSVIPVVRASSTEHENEISGKCCVCRLGWTLARVEQSPRWVNEAAWLPRT